ncbi:MAG: pyridoxal phosphate-dependent aminotransferase [Deltaproteobacteria bacterium]
MCRKVKDMAPSGIRIFFDLVLGMKDVISLGVGEPDFVSPWPVREAAIFSLEQGFTSYTSNKGLYKLRLGLSRFIKSRWGLEYSPDEEMLITVGVSEGLDLACRALLEPGDKVLIPQPGYVSYGPVVDLAGGVPVFIDTRSNGFKLTPKILEKYIDRRTKAIIFNYPANPTGVSYTRPELLALSRVLLKHKIICITDECYADLTYDFEHTPFASLPGMRDMTVFLNGFSKSFAMTGWRLGYACGNREIIGAMTKIHQYTMLCAPITSQMAACEALHSCKGSVDSMRREYRRRREMFCDGLEKLGLEFKKPEGAFYVFASVKKCSGLEGMDFAKRLLQQQKVAVVPGTAFGDLKDHIRMSYASSYDNLKEALKRMEAFIGSLR